MEAAEVRRRVSAVEMLPTTLEALSMTAREVRPSLDIKTRASARGASALVSVSKFVAEREREGRVCVGRKV